MILQPTDWNKTESSAYYREFFQKIDALQFEEAEEFLTFLFQNAERQKKKGKPSDFLFPEEKRETDEDTLYAHYRRMISQFHFSESLESRVDRILKDLEETLQDENEMRAHQFQPWNGLLFRCSDFEFCSAILNSIHFDPKTGRISPRFGLDLEMIWDADSYPPEKSSEVYDFIYDLQEGEYEIVYKNETIPGKELHLYVKLILFTKMIRTIVETLLKEKRFAEIPKKFPFYVFIDSEECYDYSQKPFLFEINNPIELKSLQTNPHFPSYQKASELKTQFSMLEELLFYLDFLENPETEEYQNILKLLSFNQEWVSKIEQTARKKFLSSHETSETEQHDGSEEEKSISEKITNASPQSFTKLFWELAKIDETRHGETARKFQTEILSRKPFEPEDNYQKVIPYIQNFTYEFVLCFLTIPETFREEFLPLVETELVSFQNHPHPAFALRSMEIRYWLRLSGRNIHDNPQLVLRAGKSFHLKKTDWETKDRHPIFTDPPEEYLNLLIDLVDCMPEEFPWFGESWDFIFQSRLVPLGKLAKRCVPAVVAALERYNRSGLNESCTLHLAPILYKIGCKDVPESVHKLHKNNRFYLEEFYDSWSQLVPRERWVEFLDRFRNFPEDFAAPQTWEHVLYDSEPGFQVYYENIEELPERNRIFYALLRSLKNEPGPVLKKFSLFYCEALAETSSKKRDRFFQSASEIAELLNLLRNEKAENEKLKFLYECAVSAKAIEFFLENKPDTADILKRTLTAVPDNGLLYFLKVNWVEKEDGIGKAIEELRLSLRILWKNDSSTQNSLFSYLLSSNRDWNELSRGSLYSFYKKTKTIVLRRLFTEGKFSSELLSLRFDPFLNIIKNEYSKMDTDDRRIMIEKDTVEFGILEKIDSFSDNDLAAFLKPENSSLNFLIASRLVENARVFSAELLRTLDWETSAESAFPLLKLFFQDSRLKDKLFSNSVFQKFLSYFILEYRDVPAKDLAKILFSRFKETEKSDVIVQAAKDMNPETILNCFISIHWAFQRENKLPELEILLSNVLRQIDVRRPEYVLFAANLAVIHVQNGNLEKGKEVFESLFAQDWSRFEYRKDTVSAFTNRALDEGPNDHQYTIAFRKYYAMAKFNAACLYSKLREPETSVSHLREAVRLEPEQYNKDKILSERDFRALSETQSYREFLSSLN
ncbi:anaphase-promoting complex subunit 5 domain protein [Leptospira gomenensis]|uniref:Anaphase-promoting complex subunit 5 domain protein n=1 Tax=Leptospira gomenensis TaxID=2484974 RepID=A0A5F1Y9H0_9LEPT|nr:anaphase-promoting complex subunit 5 domain protein [Leptospira gomenensis]TGK31129.1 anaphase-promoting complex subunit 5 domain protein [Leptospira gomenensis]TGK41759.1 anaphase-promoting complex subunit 5 domain protein [Leptospira gomenensis]TGK43333.1 anaphase-promoting complex subunit 5 domain protein [Leptospira gomenensis]TGK56381.1 anaphase-promoting complex subunit 5 domain protein [Leptospira gomenensis]